MSLKSLISAFEVCSAESTVKDGKKVSECDQPKNRVLTIDRALSVLDLMASTNSDSLGVTDIARDLNLSKAVVHRILVTLVMRDYLQVNAETRRYSLGRTALVLGSAYLKSLNLHSEVLPHLQKLSDLTGETATFSILHGWTRFYVNQVTPIREIKMSVEIGKPHALHAGSSSKAFLAFIPLEDQERYLVQRDLNWLTDKTITDSTRLRQELVLVRQRGYATSIEERQRGAASIAAPIFDHTGQPIAVISICGPAERFREQFDIAPKLLRQACEELSQRFGFST